MIPLDVLLADPERKALEDRFSELLARVGPAVFQMDRCRLEEIVRQDEQACADNRSALGRLLGQSLGTSPGHVSVTREVELLTGVTCPLVDGKQRWSPRAVEKFARDLQGTEHSDVFEPWRAWWAAHAEIGAAKTWLALPSSRLELKAWSPSPFNNGGVNYTPVLTEAYDRLWPLATDARALLVEGAPQTAFEYWRWLKTYVLHHGVAVPFVVTRRFFLIRSGAWLPSGFLA